MEGERKGVARLVASVALRSFPHLFPPFVLSIIDGDPDLSFSGDALIVTVKRRILKESAENVMIEPLIDDEYTGHTMQRL
jgi:hypothetical protein